MELPSDAEIVAALTQMVASARANPVLELEIRVGTFARPKGFIAGVSDAYSCELFAAMTNNVAWAVEPKMRSFRYIYFDDNVRGMYSPDGSNPVFHRVRTVSTLDMACSVRDYGLRASLKEEVPLPNYFTVSKPATVRLNTRCSFGDAGWRYDFTKTAQGTSTETACQSQTVYMVELEFYRDEAYLEANTDAEIAVDLLGRGRDLLGRFNASEKREDLPLRRL